MEKNHFREPIQCEGNGGKSKMNKFRLYIVLAAVCSLIAGGARGCMPNAYASAVEKKELSAATHKELAEARRATAKYHDVAQAEADGYVNFNLYMSGEGYHYIKLSLLDGNFDPSQPEMLLYAPVPGEDRLQLVGVEYLVPISFSSEAPAGFTGDADEWRRDMEGFGLWELNAWI